MEEERIFTILISYDTDLKYHRTENRIFPGLVYVRNGNKVYFCTRNSAAKIYFPEFNILFKETLTSPIIELGENDCSQGFIVENKSDNRVFSYAVYNQADREFAEGDSTPKIIVE